jgi:hypothetical protein
VYLWGAQLYLIFSHGLYLLIDTIIHARNLDYDIPLKNLTAKITFTRAGEVAYFGTAFVGYLGLLTGMRPGGWSVSVDERDQNGTTFDVFLQDVIAAAQDARLVRRTSFFLNHKLPPLSLSLTCCCV